MKILRAYGIPIGQIRNPSTKVPTKFFLSPVKLNWNNSGAFMEISAKQKILF